MSTPEIYQKLTDAIGAHGAWKHRLRVAVHMNDRQDLVKDAGDHHNCAFGRWLDGLSPEVRGSQEAQETIRRHAEFHSKASKVAQKIVLGQKDLALALLDAELSEASKVLTSAVSRWKFAVSR